MSLTYENLDIVEVPGENVTVTLPKFMIVGAIANQGGVGENNTPILDFQNGEFSEPNGGSSMFGIMGAIKSNESKRAKLLAALKEIAPALARAFAGVENQ